MPSAKNALPINVDDKIFTVQEDGKTVSIKYLTDYPNYGVSDDGRIWSQSHQKFITTHLNNMNAEQVSLRNDETREKTKELRRRGIKSHGRRRFLVGRLVAKAWVANTNNKIEVNHLDGDRSNNHPSNLQWVTHKENMADLNHPGGVQGFKKRDPNSYARYCKQIGIRSKARWKALTQAEKDAFGKMVSRNARGRFAKMTPEQRSAWQQRVAEANRQMWARLTPAQRHRKTAAARDPKHNAVRVAATKKYWSDPANRRWQSEQGKKRWADKRAKAMRKAA